MRGSYLELDSEELCIGDKMEREKQEAIIEAVLFTMGESVEISKLAELIEETKGNTKKMNILIT